MKMAKAIREQAVTAEQVAATSADAFVANQMKTLAQAFRTQAELIKKNKKKQEKEEMRFSIKAKCRDGEILHRRKTPEAALKKAREMSQTGCYDIHITTPEGRDYHSSEFADLPRTPVARRPSQPSRVGGQRSRQD
jgi:hypothetical protein